MTVDPDDPSGTPGEELTYLIDLSGDYFVGSDRAIVPNPDRRLTRPAPRPGPSGVRGDADFSEVPW
jgi:hypothetical protein